MQGNFYNKKNHEFLSELSVFNVHEFFILKSYEYSRICLFILPSSHAYHIIFFLKTKMLDDIFDILLFFFSSLYSNIKFFANVQSTKFYLNIFLNVNIILFYLGVTEHESFRYLNFSFFFYIKSSWPKNLSKFLFFI